MFKENHELRRQQAQWKNGTGTITLEHFLEEDEAYNAGRLFAKVTIEPGNAVGYHQHIGDSETFYILSGEATVNENGVERVLHPGDVAVCPDGAWHSIGNNGTENMEYLAIILYNHTSAEI